MEIFRDHNFLAQFNIFLQREQRISTTVLMFNHSIPASPASLQPASSVSLLSNTVATVSSHSPSSSLFYSLFFHLVSCTSSVFKVQSTKAGCLSPEAVIDRLTKREIEKNETGERYGEEEWARAGREDASRARLNRRVYFCPSRCVIIEQKTPRTHEMR